MHEQATNADNCCCAQFSRVGLVTPQHLLHQGQGVLPAADLQAVQMEVETIKYTCSPASSVAKGTKYPFLGRVSKPMG